MKQTLASKTKKPAIPPKPLKAKRKTKAKPKSKPRGVAARIKDGFGKMALRVESIFTSEPKDIVEAIKQDHEGLREYLGILKDTEQPMDERRSAYEAFSALLKSHTVCEEDIVYKSALKLSGREMHIKLSEGFVEHHLADDLMARIEKTKDPMNWSAHANVLSEIVEHHLKEEERDLLPLIRKAASPADNMEMLAEFLSLRGKTQKKITPKNAGVLKAVADA